MKSSKHGESILVSIENITPLGFWLFIKGQEYFLNYQDYPYFKEQTIKAIQNVKLLHDHHLYWPDLEIDNLENPKKYPLKSKVTKTSFSRNPVRRVAHA